VTWADRVIGACLLGVAGVYYRYTYDIQVGLASDLLGPAFFPRALAVLLAVAGAALILRTFRGRRAAGEAPGEVGDAPWRLAWTLLLCVVYLLGLPHVGFLLLTPVFLGLFTWMLGYRRWRPLVGTAVGTTVVLYVLFATLLRVRLPRGLLG
jgi:hypothetical protein